MPKSLAQPYCLYIGSETGILKRVDVEQKTWNNVNKVEKIDKEKEIVALCWNDSQETEICQALRNCSVEILSDGSVRKVLDLSGGEGIFKGFDKIDDDYLTCTEKGSMRLWSSNAEQKLEKSVGSNVCCMRINPVDQKHVATGGKENELKIWNLDELQQPIFTAKNPPHDWLNLRKPVWVLDAAFLPETNHVVTSTSYHQIRVYDPAAQRRPVAEISFGESPITTISCRSNKQQIMIGNSQGHMALVDLRGKGHVVQQYKGSLGGVRQVLCDPSGDVVFSCGLDRFLRIHDVDSRELVNKFYLKSRLNCLLLQSHQSAVSQQVTSEDQSQLHSTTSQSSPLRKESIVEDEDEVMWSNMEVITDGKLKRKSKAASLRELREAQRDNAMLVTKTKRRKSSGKSER